MPDVLATVSRRCRLLAVLALGSIWIVPATAHAQGLFRPPAGTPKPLVARPAAKPPTGRPGQPALMPQSQPAQPQASPSQPTKPEPPPTDYECRFTDERITIDGRADEAAWKLALVIDDFRMAWVRKGSTEPRTATRARMLWDREYLYFYAEMDDTDLYADVKQHDGQTWNNDVIELFLKPAVDKPGYYEFQINAAGTTLDMFLPRRGAGGYDRFKADGDFDFPAAVTLQGTLNQWTDTDTGWTAEGRLAWKDFARTGGRPNPGERWTFAFCRYDYSVDFEGPALSSSAPLKTNPSPMFHYFEDYAPLRFVGPNKAPETQAQAPPQARPQPARPPGLERLAPLVTSRVVGSPDRPPPYGVERIFPDLPLEMPIVLARQPGSDWLWVATQPYSYAPASLRRFHNTPAAAELETLLPAAGDTAIYDICFHPRFAENGWVYLGGNGSYGGAKRSRITRYHVDPAPPHRFDPASATTIIEWESDGHNGAALAFGPDGLLYVTSGDGTSDSDQNLRGQNLAELTAKVLRIDVDHPAHRSGLWRAPGQSVCRPTGHAAETWAYGLRNPWRISIECASRTVWVGNNGQDLWEQVYLVQRGELRLEPGRGHARFLS